MTANIARKMDDFRPHFEDLQLRTLGAHGLIKPHVTFRDT